MKLHKSPFNFLHYEVKNIEIKVLKKSKEANGFLYSVESSISKINYHSSYASFGLRLHITGEYKEEKYREVDLEMIGVFEGFKTFEMLKIVENQNDKNLILFHIWNLMR